MKATILTNLDARCDWLVVGAGAARRMRRMRRFKATAGSAAGTSDLMHIGDLVFPGRRAVQVFRDSRRAKDEILAGYREFDSCPATLHTLTGPKRERRLAPRDYVGQPVNIRQGQEFRPWDRRGWTSFSVLPELRGRPWDAVALAYAHALRPSHIRVIRAGQGVQLDAQVWRVTVFLDRRGRVARVEQEVEVGLPRQCAHGAALDAALRHGLDSPQVRWHSLRGNECFSPAGHFKFVRGKAVPYPGTTLKQRK